MASNDGDNSSSWWGNLIKSAKEKSKTALEIMKTDLAEFTSTMTSDLNQASAQLIDPKSTQSFLSSTLSYITGESENLTTTKPSNETDTSSSTINIKMSLQNRYEEELSALRTNESTYLTDPKPDAADEFSEWFATFDPDSNKSEISNLLIEQADMRLLYSQLVPAKVSNAHFWGRYFFKVNQLEEDHKKRAKLLERADEVISTEKETTDWDEDLEEENNKTVEEQEDIESPDTETTTPKDKDEKAEETELKSSEPEAAEAPEIEEDKMISSPSDSQIVVDAESVEAKSDSSVSSASNISSKGQLGDKLEMSQKTEDSDDWEKVSEASDKNKPSGDADEETTVKSEAENDDQEEEEEQEEEETDLNKTPTSKPGQKEEEEEEEKESDDQETKPSKSKSKKEDDWDDWE